MNSVLSKNLKNKVLAESHAVRLGHQQNEKAFEHEAVKKNVPLEQMQLQFRDAMSHLAAAVNIVTTNGSAGQAGFTASAVCSVTDTPPTLLVCLNRNASVYRTFKENHVLCVNTLAQHHHGLSNLFGGKTPMNDRFGQGTWHQLCTGSPVLIDAVVAFDCKICEINSVGTHDILLCEVLETQINHGEQGLIYFNRAYHHLTRQQ